LHSPQQPSASYLSQGDPGVITPFPRHCRKKNPRLLPNLSAAIIAITWLLCGSTVSVIGSETPAAGAATHNQEKLITVVSGPGERVTTFAVDGTGRVLAGVAAASPMIRVYSLTGELVARWKLPVPPEAINVGPKGDIFVAGQGRLLRLDDQGGISLERATPNMATADQAAQAVHQRLTDKRTKAVSDKLQSEIRRFKKHLANRQQITLDLDRELFALDQRDLEDNSPEITQEIEQERTRLQERRAHSAKLEARLQYLVVNPPSQQKSSKMPPGRGRQISPEPDPVASVQQLIADQMKIASISASRDEVFFACSSSTGLGFDVWRTNYQFADGRKIGESLLGCCGQLDVQANDNGIYVAENTRHRVRGYDREGRQLLEFGSRERDKPEGFSGCCNPMNVAFGGDGSVYTAESGIGRIKRFSADGLFIELVGQVELVPGCKKVAISVSPKGDQVYMLDITRGHIVVMTRNTPPSARLSAEKSGILVASEAMR
jgi:sugar lactone lactonase YvrE